MDDIIKLISSVGFPIVMCLLQWYDKRTAFDNNTKALETVKKSIDQNTEILFSLCNEISRFNNER